MKVEIKDRADFLFYLLSHADKKISRRASRRIEDFVFECCYGEYKFTYIGMTYRLMLDIFKDGVVEIRIGLFCKDFFIKSLLITVENSKITLALDSDYDDFSAGDVDSLTHFLWTKYMSSQKRNSVIGKNLNKLTRFMLRYKHHEELTFTKRDIKRLGVVGHRPRFL